MEINLTEQNSCISAQGLQINWIEISHHSSFVPPIGFLRFVMVCIFLRYYTPLCNQGKGGNIEAWETTILVRAECVLCPWLQAETKVATILGN